MASGRLIFPGFMPCENANGDRVAGARAYFFLDGTATLADVYTDNTLTTAHTRPVVADTVGVWPAMYADTSLLFTVAGTDGDGVPISGFAWSGLGPAVDAALASATLAESAQAAAEAAQEAAEAAQDIVEGLAADLTGAPYSATSITSLLIGTGNKTLTLDQLGKLFTVGQTVVIARTSAATNQMTGIVTAFNATTGVMTVAVSITGGAGTFTDWSVSLSSSGGVQSIAGENGVVTAAEAKAALAIAAADITDFTGAVDTRAIAFAVSL